MEGEFSVKGFIKATLNDSVSLSYSLAKDYKAYEEKLDNSKTASSAFAMLSMVLNKIVFNKDYYKITNPKILSTDTAHISTQKIKLNEINFSITDSANMRYLILCSSFTQTQAVCGTPGLLYVVTKMDVMQDLAQQIHAIWLQLQQIFVLV